MSSFDDNWAKAADDALALLPAGERDQAEALVREICRDPYGLATDEVYGADPRERTAVSGMIAITYMVDEIGDLVYVVRVQWGG